MLPDDIGDIRQFDGLAAELAEAGRTARGEDARFGEPKPAFRQSLLHELRTELLAAAPALDVEPAWHAPVDSRLPVVAPTKVPLPSVERRGPNRPFTYRQPAVAPAYPEPQPPVAVNKPHAASRPLPTGSLRWIAIGLAACLVVASAFVGSGFLSPSKSIANVDNAVAVTLMRGGVSRAIMSGYQLNQGDELKVAVGGRATLRLGDGYIRLAGGADLALRSLDAAHVSIDQLAGRVFYRAAVPVGGDYAVMTGAVTWRATGTAFDVDRQAAPGGGELVRGLALYHSLALRGLQLDETLPEGSQATIALTPDGSRSGVPVLATFDSGTLADDWLAGNARLDAGLGLPLGRLVPRVSTTSSVSAMPSPSVPAGESPTAQLSPESTATPASSASVPVPSSSPMTGPVRTFAPTAAPTTAPASVPPTVDLGPLVVADNIDLTLTFSWTAYTGSDFSFYELVYEPTSSGRTPSVLAGSSAWATPAKNVISARVAGIGPGDYQVRIEALGYVEGVLHVYGASTTAHVHLSAARFSASPSASG